MSARPDQVTKGGDGTKLAIDSSTDWKPASGVHAEAEKHVHVLMTGKLLGNRQNGVYDVRPGFT